MVTVGVVLPYLLLDSLNDLCRVADIGKRYDCFMRSDEPSLEIQESLIGKDLAHPTARHSDSLSTKRSNPDQLVHILHFSFRLETLLHQSLVTSKSCFSLKARSSSKLTMMSISSWKKEHLRYALSTS